MRRWSRLSLAGLMVVGIGMSFIATQAQAETYPGTPLTPANPVLRQYKNLGTGLCLDGADEGSDIYTSPCWGEDGGQFWGYTNGEMRNYKSDRCLDVNETGITHTSGCSIDDPGQRWTMLVETHNDQKIYRFVAMEMEFDFPLHSWGSQSWV